MAEFEGGCLCGAVRFICEGEPLGQVACHCRDCQHLAGGGAAHGLVLPTDLVQMTQGAPVAYAKLSDAGNRVTRFFCQSCGTQLFLRSAAHPEQIRVNAGALDDPSIYRPEDHAWVASAPLWHAREDSFARLFRGAA
ncbi:MAG: GFA family protein [Rhodoblastus sp.]